MAARKLTKKSLLLVFIFLILISGVMGILREVFLKVYEEQYHFWISMLMGIIAVATMMFFARYLARKNG
jgi:uncharacterized membrane protein HdeD (DUF308 family)